MRTNFFPAALKWLIPSICLVVVGVYLTGFGEQKTDFNTEVKPILNRKCMSCHGGVKKNGGFSLLFRTDALEKTESGKSALIPGDPDHSEMIRRLTLDDPEERMPYGENPLTEAEIHTLKKWVKEGAVWGDHWAYVPVKEQKVPVSFWEKWMGKGKWAKNDIDWFVLSKIKQAGLTPSPQADRATLIRRVSLDLTGIPATQAMFDRFMAEPDLDAAYAQLVDSLLASPSFGEKWASMWLDIARYADTKGYERDDSRSIWKYREWLIRAFNADMPYDQFITEQLAGDLLPNPTDDQYLATAFHRNSMTNDEGGTDNEEFRVAAVLDRVNTTWEGLMGTTFACVQCHSHPYDPFLHDAYYEFSAFFNNSRDEDTWADYPLLYEFKQEDSLKVERVKDWLHQHAEPEAAKAVVTFMRTHQPAINSLTADHFINAELNDTKWLNMRNKAVARLKEVNLSGKKSLFVRFQNYAGPGTVAFRIDGPDGPLLTTLNLQNKTGYSWSTWDIFEIPSQPTEGVHDLYITYSSPVLKGEESGIQFDWFYFSPDFPGKDKPGQADTKALFTEVLRADPAFTTPIMMDNPAEMYRPSYVFERGNWLVHGKEVTAATPKSLPAFPKNAPNNRLGLAQWMTDPGHPLVSRTYVNRIWEQLFGKGLVETVEDLGTQGIPPTHPELLDHLAYQLMHEQGWSTKKMLRQMVLSATYRQDSKVSKEALEKDAFNQWLARGQRVRLSAEQIRDQALAASGLLSPKMYGPSVFPYQPPGIWMSPWNGATWKKSEGEDQYRRSLYTYWKRSSPYPSAMTFDGVSREVCTSRRIRTNTPLQALVTLNDEVHIEAARHMALLVLQNKPKGASEQIGLAFGWATGKAISPEKAAVFRHLYDLTFANFQQNPAAVCEMTDNLDGLATPEGAAMVMVTNSILNLDEFLTKN